MKIEIEQVKDMMSMILEFIITGANHSPLSPRELHTVELIQSFNIFIDDENRIS